jgi:hypothetical protein
MPRLAPLLTDSSAAARVVPGLPVPGALAAPHATAGSKMVVSRARTDRCLLDTIGNPIDASIRTFRWMISHGTLGDVLRETSGFSAEVGTVYAISLHEWLRLASQAPATADRQFRKCVLKMLDAEAQS